MRLFGIILLVSLAVQYCSCALYGYTTAGSKGGIIYTIDPQTGASKSVCDVSSLGLPALAGAATSTDLQSGVLLFNYVKGNNIFYVQIDPTTCKATTKQITCLRAGQNQVRDMKYNAGSDKLYMVFPNPNCMHGSLAQVDTTSASVVSFLADIVDPVGFSQTTGMSQKAQQYFFAGIPFPSPAGGFQYILNSVSLSTGNVTAMNLTNNDVDIGDAWGTNYTLNAYDSASGPVLFGAVTPSATTNKMCNPTGFFTIDGTSGAVQCVAGPIEESVVVVGELDRTDLIFYQIVVDTSNNFYLYTYDVQKQTIVSKAPCTVCEQVSVLAYL